MVERLRYSMLIQWSDEDRVYIVSLPEWRDLIHTHGDTYADAARMGNEVLEMPVDIAREEGGPLPEPRVFAASS
ncbi:MAG: type II toxin-antitoxin system HicB family antitoxin [Chloroflexota bacterium]|nr:type II toxin-antitoxin system HicB family antitoxin [Chloroflexota bacterium]